MPFDVDPAVLAEASEALAAEYPGLRIAPFAGRLRARPGRDPGRAARRMIAFLGSTIGNLEPAARAAFLRQVGAALRPGDTFLLGTDLVKDTGRLLRAYDDAAGVTAEFNRNVLRVINRELDADFAVERVRARRGLGRRPRVDRDAAALGRATSRSRSATWT